MGINDLNHPYFVGLSHPAIRSLFSSAGLFCSSSPERPPPVPAGTWPTASQYLGGTAYGEKVFLEPLKSAEGVLREVSENKKDQSLEGVSRSSKGVEQSEGGGDML